MQGQEQYVLRIGEAQQGGTHQRSLGQVERPLEVCLRQRRHLALPLALRKTPQIYHRQGQGGSWCDDLIWLACDIGKRGAQDFMTADHRLEALP